MAGCCSLRCVQSHLSDVCFAPYQLYTADTDGVFAVTCSSCFSLNDPHFSIKTDTSSHLQHFIIFLLRLKQSIFLYRPVMLLQMNDKYMQIVRQILTEAFPGVQSSLLNFIKDRKSLLYVSD